MRLARGAVVCAAALWLLAAAAGATRVSPAPFGVDTSSLGQNGRQLVWTVQLDHPFAPATLTKRGRSLCLLLERAHGGSVLGVLCVGPTKDGVHPQLAYQRVTRAGRGTPLPIPATITRSEHGTGMTARFDPSRIDESYRSLRWQVLSTLSSPACTPAKPSPLGCTTEFPAMPALAKLHTPHLIGCVPSGAPYVTGGSPKRHDVALTFDDGPWPDTPQFLDVLEENQVPATFFQIGNQVGTYGAAVDRRMLADGDMIGDHTWNHPNVAGAGQFARNEISEAAAAIRQLTGFTPCLFRAPYGATSPALISEARSMGFTTIQWNVDPRDWARPGVGAIDANVVDNARNGSIIIQHDGGGDRSETIAALPREIAKLRSRGYRFVTVTQLLGQRLIYK